MTNKDILKRRIEVLTNFAEITYNIFKNLADVMKDAVESLESEVDELDTLDQMIEEDGQ